MSATRPAPVTIELASSATATLPDEALSHDSRADDGGQQKGRSDGSSARARPAEGRAMGTDGIGRSTSTPGWMARLFSHARLAGHRSDARSPNDASQIRIRATRSLAVRSKARVFFSSLPVTFAGSSRLHRRGRPVAGRTGQESAASSQTAMIQSNGPGRLSEKLSDVPRHLDTEELFHDFPRQRMDGGAGIAPRAEHFESIPAEMTQQSLADLRPRGVARAEEKDPWPRPGSSAGRFTISRHRLQHADPACSTSSRSSITV